MLKLKMIINFLSVLTILFCYHSVDSSTVYGFGNPAESENVIADPCPPPEDSGQSGGGVSTITGDHV